MKQSKKNQIVSTQSLTRTDMHATQSWNYSKNELLEAISKQTSFDSKENKNVQKLGNQLYSDLITSIALSSTSFSWKRRGK